MHQQHVLGNMQAHAQVTLKGGSDKAAAAELADKEQTILELRETNEVLRLNELETD